MNKTLIIILIVVVLLLCCCLTTGLAGFFSSVFEFSDNLNNNTSTTTSTYTTTSTTPEITGESILFESEEYGFSLELPASWEGYDVFGGKGADGSEVEYLYSFNYEGDSPMEVYAFTVAIYSLETWEDVKDYEYNQGAKVAEDDKYIYTMSNDPIVPPDVYQIIKESFKLSEE